MRRLPLAALVAVFLYACGTAYIPHPTPEHPIAMCSITCAKGARTLFTAQHLCAGGGSRFFEDFRAIGEYEQRNAADGTLEIARWIACASYAGETNGRCARTQDFPKSQVEPMSCSTYIHQLVQQREPSQRGQFPGEDEQGRPNQ